MSGYHRSDDAQAYRRNASFVYSSEYTAPVLRLLDARPGERILDLGCGSGELTLQLAQLVGPSGTIVGVDASGDMIDKATALHQQSGSSDDLAPVTFRVHDAHDPFQEEGQFDKVFSNAALHWMKRSPRQVLLNVHSSLKPGGRFAAELGGFMNCIGVRSHLHSALRKRNLDPALLDPWIFPSPEQYTFWLQDAGFTVDSCELVPRLTPLPKESGLKGWLSTFAGPFLNAIDSERVREEVVDEVEEALRPDAFDEQSGTWYVMYVRLRVRAHKA
ncbi:hypothetical protein EX895_004980 [Sporisorium graminicola]|uniref:Methyltransferase domain-containing protein n=1 Tax=Sporisorium graminicola TaxID=280036 RepID=A0A4U7KNU5_9BASI|nr:hypothetical protein EX895_004980 [Sporisorium graminicola]TKY86155.1 hypothetical protein EX895_004980 [Sporisorium graminicola]